MRQEPIFKTKKKMENLIEITIGLMIIALVVLAGHENNKQSKTNQNKKENGKEQ